MIKIKNILSKLPPGAVFALSGLFTALPFLSEDLAIIGWVAAAPAFYLLTDTRDAGDTFLRRYRHGFLFFYAFKLAVFYWFIELYPLDFAGLDKYSALAVVAVAWLGLPLLQASLAAFSFVFLKRFYKSFVCRAPYMFPIIAGTVYALFEYFETLTWAGVPWGRLAVGQTSMLAAVQSASLFGSYFVSFLMIAVSASIALGVRASVKSKASRRSAIAYFTAAASVFSVNLIGGFCAIEYCNSQESTSKITVAALQGNVLSSEKWEEGKTDATVAAYLSLIGEAAAGGAEVIVLPETAITFTLSESAYYRRLFENAAKQTGTTLLIGTFRTGEDGLLYNAVDMISPSGEYSEAFYAKRHLVPFGEYVPWRSFFTAVIPPLAEIGMLSDDLLVGESSALHETEHGRIASLICFDSIYEALTLSAVRDGAELLAVSTNDSWFRDSRAVWQHNSQAILRAIEVRRDTVRSANTGVSSVIRATGETVSMLEPLVFGMASGEVEMRSELSLYSRIGDLFIAVSGAVTATCAAISAVISLKQYRAARKERRAAL